MTGGVKILRYTVAHDAGRVINPLIVDGQVQGGVAHGIGNALLEWMQYDANAQPLTTSFADYMLPMATDVPTCAIAHVEIVNPLNPLGVKGAGEGGTIPAPAAIIVSDRRRAVAVRRAFRRDTADAGAHRRRHARRRRLRKTVRACMMPRRHERFERDDAVLALLVAVLSVIWRGRRLHRVAG